VIVVDSSVLIGFLKGQTSPAIEVLERLELENAFFALPGVCYQEVLQGAKDEKEWKLLERYLGAQELLFPTDPIASHREAARILEEDGILLHEDGDFEYIRRVRPLKTFQFEGAPHA
jgi:predicted nucleic acid-binding protein